MFGRAERSRKRRSAVASTQKGRLATPIWVQESSANAMAGTSAHATTLMNNALRIRDTSRRRYHSHAIVHAFVRSIEIGEPCVSAQRATRLLHPATANQNFTARIV